MKQNLRTDARIGLDRIKGFQSADPRKSIISIESFHHLYNTALRLNTLQYDIEAILWAL